MSILRRFGFRKLYCCDSHIYLLDRKECGNTPIRTLLPLESRLCDPDHQRSPSCREIRLSGILDPIYIDGSR